MVGHHCIGRLVNHAKLTAWSHHLSRRWWAQRVVELLSEILSGCLVYNYRFICMSNRSVKLVLQNNNNKKKSISIQKGTQRDCAYLDVFTKSTDLRQADSSSLGLGFAPSKSHSACLEVPHREVCQFHLPQHTGWTRGDVIGRGIGRWELLQWPWLTGALKKKIII